MQDFDLPEERKKVMAHQASAEGEKRATITKAEGDRLAAINLAEAAKLMAENPIADTFTLNFPEQYCSREKRWHPVR